jgi:rubrerythrin
MRLSLLKKGKWIEPKLPKPEKPRIFSEKDWDREQGGDAVTPILFALWKEKQAQEFYSSAAAKVKSLGAKRFFSALAEFEKNHAEMLAGFVEDSFYTHELIMG